MSEVAIPLAPSSRMRVLVLPREHGAWGILAVPLLTGAAVGLKLTGGARVPPLLLFTVAAMALFCLRTPLESLLGGAPMRAQTNTERHNVVLAIVVLGTLALLAVYLLVGHGQNAALLTIGGIAALMFVLQRGLRRFGRKTRMVAQVVGALGLTCTSAGAYAVVTGRLDERAVALWMANWVFAGNQIHYVQLRIHGAKLKRWTEKLATGWGFFAGQIVVVIGLALGWRFGFLPGWAAIAFLPILIRGTQWFFAAPQPLRVHRLGFTELAHNIVFGALLVAAFYFA